MDGVSEAWSAYWADGTPETRDRLLLQYAPLVKYVSSREADGSEGAARLGLERLSAAIESFHPINGEKFEPYAMDAVAEGFADPAGWDEGWAEVG